MSLVSDTFADATRLIDRLSAPRRVAVDARFRGLTDHEREAYQDLIREQLAAGQVSPAEARRLRDIIDGWDAASLPDRLAATLLVGSWIGQLDLERYFREAGLRRQPRS